MAWAKLDDGFWSNPKLMRVGVAACGLFARGLTYAAQHLTDGFVPEYMLLMLTDGDPALADKLVKQGLWEEDEDGWQIKSYLEFNPSKEDVIRRRERDRSRQASHRESRRDTERSHRSPPRARTAASPRFPSRPVPSPSVSDSNESSSEPSPDAAPSEGDKVTGQARALLRRWNERAGQRLTWKTWGPKLKPRIREHGPAAVAIVLKWYFEGRSKKAVFLRDGGYGLDTLLRRSKFEPYLEEARREFTGAGEVMESSSAILARHHKVYGYAPRPEPELALLKSAYEREGDESE